MTILTSLLSGAASTATSFLGGIQTYLIIGAISVAVGVAGGFYAGYRWELGTYETLVAADATAVTVAEKTQDTRDKAELLLGQTAGIKEGEAQAQIQVVTVTQTKEIPAHVTPIQVTRACLSVGLMRLLRAASGETDPDSLTLAAGQSDDDCSAVSPVTVAGWFTGYAAASEANAEQLNALIAWENQDRATQQANQ